MSDDNEPYKPKNAAEALSRLAEECSEVIKVCMKMQRFGYFSSHPGEGRRTNMTALKEELSDLEEASEDFFRLHAQERKG